MVVSGKAPFPRQHLAPHVSAVCVGFSVLTDVCLLRLDLWDLELRCKEQNVGGALTGALLTCDVRIAAHLPGT